jgi:NAD(P)-dependent dehydrogenase (short-subunit alcohol dehydrogenase family)
MKHVRDLLDLSGKVAVVTGGAGKYGLGMVEGLAEGGARVVMASRNEKNCRQKADEFKARGLDVKAAPLDLADEKSIKSLIKSVLAEEGKIDVLVNNAVGRIEEKGLDGRGIWDQSMRVNAVGLYVCTAAALEAMIKKRSGNIINIASMYGLVGQNPAMYPGTGMDSSAYGDYFFHKAGMINYTRYLATRFAEYNIRANCISPGGLLADQSDEFLRRYNERVPLKRMAVADDIKGAVVYLASEASAYVTGHNLVMDGGWTIW